MEHFGTAESSHSSMKIGKKASDVEGQDRALQSSGLPAAFVQGELQLLAAHNANEGEGDTHPEVESLPPTNKIGTAHVYQLVYQVWTKRSNDPLKRRKPALLRAFVYNWCPGEDSNLHGVAPAST